MARTYSNTPVLSKIKFPGSENTYWLKDADARAILDAISADVYEILQNALGTVDAGGNHLVNAANIKDYVDRIAEIGFDVVVLQALPTADETAYNTYHNNIVLISDVSSKTGAYVEYVILRTNTGTEQEPVYTYSWEKIGTTEVDLKGYVKDVTYDDATHTLKQTKTNNEGGTTTTDVHNFGNLADADTASGTYTLPTGSGTVTINQYDINGGNAQAITGEGTTDIPYVDALGGTTTFNVDAVKDVKLTGTQTFVVNAVKDVGLTGTGRTFTTNGIKEVSIVDNAETGTKVVNGLSGTTEFNTDAVKNVRLGGVQSFNVDGISDAQLTSTASTNTVVTGLTGTTSFAPYAISATLSQMDSECLEFQVVTNATFGVNTTTLGITTTAATFGTVTVSSEPAAKGTFSVTEKNINLSTVNADTDSFGVTYTMTQGTTANYGTVGVTSTPAATATVTVTPKHIHITHTAPTATVTVDTTTSTVTVNPDPRS